jgi:hypothetical protein
MARGRIGASREMRREKTRICGALGDRSPFSSSHATAAEVAKVGRE